MEYWVPWGETEVFFEAPPELSATIPSAQPLPEENLLARLSKLPRAPFLFIDYLPPPQAYQAILERVAETDATVYVASWRLGPEKQAEAVAALEQLERKPPIAPIKELRQERRPIDQAVLIYHGTSRLLLQKVINNPSDYLSWLIKHHGAPSLDAPSTMVHRVELSYDSRGVIQRALVEDEEQAPPSQPFNSVIVSPGGTPFDSTFYLTAQSIIIAAEACSEKTSILSVSECRDGFGPPDFVRRLYDIIKSGEETAPTPDEGPYSLIAERLADVLRRIRVYLVTALPRSLTQILLGLKSYDTIQEGFTQLLRLHGKSQRLLLIREGLHTDLTNSQTC
ncbi:MAG: hypothetical protein RMJ28_01045 [Nitrososphaerota archaeon]|nr:hypothetical protein [Candidatus Calditenuaceae archaeon]MDW8072818.1 hypothetical protein [Nitrososphaerota archaeon]